MEQQQPWRQGEPIHYANKKWVYIGTATRSDGDFAVIAESGTGTRAIAPRASLKRLEVASAPRLAPVPELAALKLALVAYSDLMTEQWPGSLTPHQRSIADKMAELRVLLARE